VLHVVKHSPSDLAPVSDASCLPLKIHTNDKPLSGRGRITPTENQ
jgi:hypothetical protein